LRRLFHEIHTPGSPGGIVDSDVSGNHLGSPKPQSHSLKLVKAMGNSHASHNSAIQDMMNMSVEKLDINEQ
jgi:hypothetical protein